MSRRLLPAAAGLVLVLALLFAGAGTGTGQQSAIVTSLTLFAGTGEGLWRSTNWGASWQRVRGALSGVQLDSFGAVRSIRTYRTEVWIAGDGGLYQSPDFGDTWRPVWVQAGIEALLLPRWPHADPTVFVSTGAGLLRSRDHGKTFGPTSLVDTLVRRLEWPGPALAVACDRGLLITTDEGGRFEGPGEGLPAGPVRSMVLSSFFSLDPVLFAAPDSGGVFRSSDGGRRWVASGLAGEVVSEMVWLGPFLYAAADGGFFRSSDAGASWTRLSASPGRPSRLLFPLAPAAGLEAFLATDRGLFRTNDAGEHWAPAGFAGQEVLEVATFPPPDPEEKK